MKKIFLISVFIAIIIFIGYFLKLKLYDPAHRIELANTEVSRLIRNSEIKEGDIIFQTSLSRQSKAIQLATNSAYSHCGIILKDNGELYVLEAIQPVKFTSLEKWIARGKDAHFVLKRLKYADQIINNDLLNKLKSVGNKMEGKNYDKYFEWSDERIYCSELIWKIYKTATGLEIGKLQHLKDFDLSSNEVRNVLKERYGDKIPMDEIVISPSEIFNSDLLISVSSN